MTLQASSAGIADTLPDGGVVQPHALQRAEHNGLYLQAWKLIADWGRIEISMGWKRIRP